MNLRPELKIDWCSHDAAKYAVEHWHYSKSLPAGKTVKVGVWENGKFIGCAIYSRGAAINIGAPYGLDQTEVCELTRMAFTTHVVPMSRVLAISLKFLVRHNPGLRLVVSFADTEQGHHGGIYQANGWIYVGDSAIDRKYRVHGKLFHPKTLHSKFGKGGQSIPWLKANVDPGAESIQTPGKRKYLMPLDDDMRSKISGLAKPYPKRAKQAMAEDHSAQRQSITDPHAPISND